MFYLQGIEDSRKFAENDSNSMVALFHSLSQDTNNLSSSAKPYLTFEFYFSSIFIIVIFINKFSNHYLRKHLDNKPSLEPSYHTSPTSSIIHISMDICSVNTFQNQGIWRIFCKKQHSGLKNIINQ